MKSELFIAGCTASTNVTRCAQMGRWHVELLPRAPYEASYTPELPIIGFSFDAQEGTHSYGSDIKKAFFAKPNGLAWVPAGCDVYSQSNGGEYLKISCQDTPCMARLAERNFTNLVDLTAISSAFVLRRTLLSKEPWDLLDCEQQLMTLEACVSTALLNPSKRFQTVGWLNTRRLKKINELVNDRIDTQLSVAELSSEMAVSAGFLSREFKRVTGRSPYQFIVDVRLSKARQLLQQSSMGLSEIAFACGFSSHSHMTSQFKKRFGVTPASFNS